MMERKMESKDVPVTTFYWRQSGRVFLGSARESHSHQLKTVFVIIEPEEFLKNYNAMTRAVCKLVVIFI
jgi:hypothetical protein